MINKLFNYLSDQLFFMKLRTRIVLYLLLIATLGGSGMFLFKDYEQNLVSQQQQHMLSVSKSISRSIELFLSEVVDSMRILTLDQSFTSKIVTAPSTAELKLYKQKLVSYTSAEGSPIYGAYLFNEKGKLIAEHSQSGTLSPAIKKELPVAMLKKETFRGTAYLDPLRRTFILNIYEPIFKNNVYMGTFCVAIDLDVIYDKLIDPVQIGKKGYALVKDQNGTIIMHKLKEQIGINVIETRKAMYPHLDFSGLEKLINEQLKAKEGTYIYYSYWWAEADQKLEKAKKLNAFSPVDLENQFWVVALTMSYDEIKAPMNKFLFGILAIAIFVALVFYLFTQALMKSRRSKEELEQETQYLKMLNESSEQLRQQEAELYHSQKLKMIGTLAGGISHDINNLLTPIYGYSELMLDQVDADHPFYEEITEIHTASKKGKDLIEQMLLFSRKDNGMTSVALIDMNQVTEETIRLLRTMLPKQIKIQMNLEPNCGFVRANFAQLHQVIFNLCMNAYQALQQDSESVRETALTISLKKIPVSLINDQSLSDEEAYSFVELSIEDTGCGMDEQTRERIFEPFFTTKDIGDGTGLGLFVVKSIIDKYGGQIQVESTPGVGSTFKVYFQLAEPEDAALEAALAASNLQNMDNPLRLLIVDDNETVNKLLKKGLDFYGYKVRTETSSIQALKYIKTHPQDIDVLITDYMMPDQNGIELAKKAKRVHKHLGIILMTGYMDEGQLTTAKHDAIDSFILKPIEIARLSEAIQKVYNQHNPPHAK